MNFLHVQKKILRKFCLVDLGIRSQTICIPSKRLGNLIIASKRVKLVKEENYDEKSIEVNTDFNVQEVNNNTIKTSCGT